MTRIMAAEFVAWLEKQLDDKCGYIMGASGQNPKTLSSWYFEQYRDRKQYTAAQEQKALYWREHAPRVFDCAGLAEGAVCGMLGLPMKEINTKARYIYKDWCGVKGDTLKTLPKRPGIAVFIHSAGKGYITHIGYLEKPVSADAPDGDWYVIEARGVSYGVVRTKLSARGWNRWGDMDRYFDTNAPLDIEELSDDLSGVAKPKTLKRGACGEEVVRMQLALIDAGYSCGRYGADGEFGSATEGALKVFQQDSGISADGICGAETWRALEAQYQTDGEASADAQEGAGAAEANTVTVTGGSVYIRAEPTQSGRKLGVVHAGDVLTRADETALNWVCVKFGSETAWITAKYIDWGEQP